MRGRSEASLGDLVKAGLLNPGEQLWFGLNRSAEAVLGDGGEVRIEGRDFQSPSSAGKHVTGHDVNGWTRWRVERPSGLITLAQVREQFLAR